MDGDSEAAIRAVLAAFDQGRPAPFELWFRERHAQLGPSGALADAAIAEAFLRLNGGLEGLRLLSREALDVVYEGQLGRTLGPRAARSMLNRLRAALKERRPERAGAPRSTSIASLRQRRKVDWSALAIATIMAAGASGGLALLTVPDEPSAPMLPSRPPLPQFARAPAPRKPRPSSPELATRPPAVPIPSARPAPPPRVAASGGKAIRVDVARRRVAIYEDGRLVRVLHRCSFGRKGHGTPLLRNASLSLNRRERLHRSRLYDGAPMPYALFLEQRPNVAFHAGSVRSLSHGCIHLTRQDAKWLFDWVGRDPVRVDIVSSAAV